MYVKMYTFMFKKNKHKVNNDTIYNLLYLSSKLNKF